MALTADRTGPQTGPTEELYPFPVKAATRIYLGALVSFDATGFLVPAADVADQAGRQIYMAAQSVDNSAGADADVCCDCHLGLISVDAGPITNADRGLTIHAIDDNTLALISTNNRPIGSLVIVEGNQARIRIP